MIETLKDLWYDVSDFLITFIIIIIVVGFISFVMTKSLGVDFALSDYLTFLRNESTPLVSIEDPVTPDPTPPVIIDPSPSPAETPSEPGEEPLEEPLEEPSDGTITVTVNPGDYLSDVAEELLRNGVISSASDFIDGVVSQGYETSLQVGEFDFTQNMSIQEVIDILFQ